MLVKKLFAVKQYCKPARLVKRKTVIKIIFFLTKLNMIYIHHLKFFFAVATFFVINYNVIPAYLLGKSSHISNMHSMMVYMLSVFR